MDCISYQSYQSVTVNQIPNIILMILLQILKLNTTLSILSSWCRLSSLTPRCPFLHLALFPQSNIILSIYFFLNQKLILLLLLSILVLGKKLFSHIVWCLKYWCFHWESVCVSWGCREQALLFWKEKGKYVYYEDEDQEVYHVWSVLSLITLGTLPSHIESKTKIVGNSTVENDYYDIPVDVEHLRKML